MKAVHYKMTVPVFCDSWNREALDNEKEQLINYFIAHGYGQHNYSEEDIRKIFKEMDALGMLFPTNANNDLVDLYTKWLHKHHTHWFNPDLRELRMLSAEGKI